MNIRYIFLRKCVRSLNFAIVGSSKLPFATRIFKCVGKFITVLDKHSWNSIFVMNTVSVMGEFVEHHLSYFVIMKYKFSVLL